MSTLKTQTKNQTKNQSKDLAKETVASRNGRVEEFRMLVRPIAAFYAS